jgi:general secretion pathway protein C
MNGRLKNWLEGDALILLAELALVAALAAMLAHWTWVLVTPATRAAPGGAAFAAEPRIDVPPGLFSGVAGMPRSEAPRTGLRLLGVVSPTRGEGGRAVVRLDTGGSRAAAVGEAIVPGVVLREVHPTHVVVERHGTLEHLKLERRALPADGSRAAR